jgi:hypothetical protein
MLHTRRGRGREHGQMLVLFALSLVVILAFAAIVVDLGLLRNNRQRLVDTLDAGALAGGTLLPVDGSKPSDVSKLQSLINTTIAANYPGLPTSTTPIGSRCVPGSDGNINTCAYTITYLCLVGADKNGPLITRDIPAVCDPRSSFGMTKNYPLTPADITALASHFTGAGLTRTSSCDPAKGDLCNAIQITGSATTPFSLGGVVGVNQGSTGTVVSVACNGPCGQSPVVPVDLVVILDRTWSMNNNNNSRGAKIQALQAAAKAILGVYDPAKQRVALGLTGPGEVDSTGKPVISSCGSGYGSAYGVADDNNFTPRTNLTSSVTSTATTIKVGPAYSLPFPTSGNFSITVESSSGNPAEQMLVTSGQGTNTWTVQRGYNASTNRTHSNGAQVSLTDGWTPSSSSVGVWVPVGLSGTDTNPVLALPSPNGTAGTYSIGGVVQAGADIVKSINCIQAYSQGTNLATPIAMAQWYLDHYGRKGVTQGIILETDGHPQCGFECSDQWHTNVITTCKAALDAATAAKADTTNTASDPTVPQGIQIFTVGYGVDSSAKCPIKTSNMNANNSTYNVYEDAAWSGRAATELLGAMATDASHYFENPASADLAKVFTQAAQVLAHKTAHLLQPYPAPVVEGLSPSSGLGGASVSVSGKYFTGATSVTFGGAAIACTGPSHPNCTVNSDIQITVTAPSGTSGSKVDIIVTTPGGTSTITPADQFTYN